ncbi:MAG: isoprenylcysteine carboxylmethyltransferase family protein [Acidobacteriota bacterium]
MGATRFEYRHRFILHVILFVLGFTAPWMYLPIWPTAGESARALSEPAWLALSTQLYRLGVLTYSDAVHIILVLALLLTALGAFFRIWGAAYIGNATITSGNMRGDRLLADGPYRRTRNPLYLGTILHTLGIALLMPPSGALFAIVTLWILQLRLAFAEESFLTQRFGEAYTAYKNTVPRFLPPLKPLLPSAGTTPHWLSAILGEFYFLGAFLTLAIFGWSFDRNLLHQGLIVSFGIAIVIHGFLLTRKPASAF